MVKLFGFNRFQKLGMQNLRSLRRMSVGAVLMCCLQGLQAAPLSADLEVHLLRGVSTTWQTVPLENSYSSAIPICNYNLISFSGTAPNYDYPPAVVRIRNITSNSFDVRIQGWEDSFAEPGDVHCLVADEGAHTLPDGTKFDAHSVLSDQTSGARAGGWGQALLEDVSASVVNTYTNHVVLGQVISYNDNRASVFHATDCESRQNEPYRSGHADGICVGKHIGMVTGSRNSETIGYLVAEAGSGTANGIIFELDRGPDSVAGNSAGNAGYNYDVTGDFTVGVTSQVGEDGGNGSWSVLYGADPLPLNQLVIAVDEEIVESDVTRNHTREIVDYWVFGAAELTLNKVVVNDNGGSNQIDDFTLEASGGSIVSGLSGYAQITDATVAPGSYSLTEVGPAGYSGTWTCTGTSVSGTSITLTVGDIADCTLTNNDIPPNLTLRKQVINNQGGTAVPGDFTLRFTNGAGSNGSGVQGDASITAVPVDSGIYDLDESAVAGYNLRSISCDGTDTNGLDGLTLMIGEVVTCTFYNDDAGVDLEIEKSVSDNTPNIGDVVTFNIVVTNNGPDDATDVTIVDVVKPGFVYLPVSIAGGDSRDDASPAGTGLDWGINTLASSASVTLTFQATVSPP